MNEFSLLWDADEGFHLKEVELPENAKKDLDIEYLCGEIGKTDQEKQWFNEILTHLTSDIPTIQYRCEIFDELQTDLTLRKELIEIVTQLRILGDFKNVRMNSLDTSSVWDLINRLKELYSYIQCIDMFYKCLQKRDVHSKGLCRLKEEIARIYENSGFAYLKEDIERLTEDVSRIKSLTLGINLDSDLNPKEVQLLSINQEAFKEKDNKVLKAFITCFAGSMANSLLKSNNGPDPVMKALTKRVEELLSVTVKDMRTSLSKHVDVSGYGITKLLPELTFYLRYAELTDTLIGRGLPNCKANCVDLDGMDLEGFYNIRLALQEKSTEKTMTLNDFSFDELRQEYILTGPNRGGKTIFTQGIGLLYVLAQAGVSVPAKKMTFQPVDQIWTHFPADENDTVSLGRLGEEADRLRLIVERATKHSLILLNESLSTTNYSEGLFIAKDIMKILNQIGCMVIYNTHMHELAADTETMEVSKKYRIVSLVMGIDGNKRNYKAVIGPPTGNSYAIDIAKKYGILYEQMVQMRADERSL